MKLTWLPSKPLVPTAPTPLSHYSLPSGQRQTGQPPGNCKR